jgi:prevent-host-death family protein
MSTWQLQQAKARLSEVIKQASTNGPQEITSHGEPTAVILSIKDYKKLTKPKPSLYEFMRSSPLVGVELDLERNKDTGRDIPL